MSSSAAHRCPWRASRGQAPAVPRAEGRRPPKGERGFTARPGSGIAAAEQPEGGLQPLFPSVQAVNVFRGVVELHVADGAASFEDHPVLDDELGRLYVTEHARGGEEKDPPGGGNAACAACR